MPAVRRFPAKNTEKPRAQPVGDCTAREAVFVLSAVSSLRSGHSAHEPLASIIRGGIGPASAFRNQSGEPLYGRRKPVWILAMLRLPHIVGIMAMIRVSLLTASHGRSRTSLRDAGGFGCARRSADACKMARENLREAANPRIVITGGAVGFYPPPFCKHVHGAEFFLPATLLAHATATHQDSQMLPD